MDPIQLNSFPGLGVLRPLHVDKYIRNSFGGLKSAGTVRSLDVSGVKKWCGFGFPFFFFLTKLINDTTIENNKKKHSVGL